jgi:hypothetical protein
LIGDKKVSQNVTKNFFFKIDHHRELGSISPTFLRADFKHSDPKVQKDTDGLTVFLRFCTLRM